jgi:hypothetical protein
MDKSLTTSCFLITVASGVAVGRANAFPNNDSPTTHSSTAISVEQAPSAIDSNETFEEFLNQFNKDYNFQKSRVIFPLRISTLIDFEINKYDTINIQSAEYQKHELTSPKSNIVDGKVILRSETISPNHHHQVIMLVEDTGIRFEYHFKMIGNLWFLCEIKNTST